MAKKLSFPNKSLLYPGALRKSIAHAIAVVRLPSVANESSWDGMNHSMQDSAGTRGTISFADNALVAAFRDDHNDRCPWHSNKAYSLEPFFKGISATLRQLADEQTLRYLLDHHEGKDQPIITTAFWAETKSNSIESAEPWGDVLANGASLVDTYFLSDDKAYADYEENYGLNDDMMKLVRELVDKRRKNNTATLEVAQVKLLKSHAKGSDSLQACRESLAEIGITIE